ncbi:Cyanovirin-N [Aspergillus karnatakaensis]|uniref:CVNH domain-containing protein n=1 Tax=Aspergillus karnatakaensis TaxID=1810916 RepID=UPI003CCCCA8D
MHRASLFFGLASAALTAAQGFSSECTDISFRNHWLIATCPTGNGDEITSSVYLSAKISNNNANLEWVENGRYPSSCQDCTIVDGATLQCQCRVNWIPRLQTATLNLEEHIANYEGHLLSNQTGPITTIPENSSTPVPADIPTSIALDLGNDDCSRIGTNVGLGSPSDCYYVNFGSSQISFASGLLTSNEGWEIIAYPDEQCTGEPVKTWLSGEAEQCVAFEPVVKAFSSRPLWNADY